MRPCRPNGACWGRKGGEDGGSLALKPMLLLPTGDDGRGLGTGRAGASLNLLAAWQAGQVTALGNLGASYNGNRAGDRTALWNASAAVLVTRCQRSPWRWTWAPAATPSTAPAPRCATACWAPSGT